MTPSTSRISGLLFAPPNESVTPVNTSTAQSHEPAEPQSRVTIRRQSADDVRTRQMVVSLDGERVATLLYGDSYSTAVQPGEHRLRVHNTLVWKTVRFVAAAGEHVRFTAINRAGPGTYSMLGLLGAGPLYVTITRET